MKTYRIPVDEWRLGYYKVTEVRTKDVYRSDGHIVYGNTTTTYDSIVETNEKIKYAWTVTEEDIGHYANFIRYRQTVVYKYYRLDFHFNVSSLPASGIQSIKLHAKLTDKNSKSPFGYYVSSVRTNAHFYPQTLLGTCTLGYPSTPYEHDTTLSGLSSTGWYVMWNKLNGDFHNQEELTFDRSNIYLVVTTDEEEPSPTPDPPSPTTTDYRTAKVRLGAGTYTAYCAGQQTATVPMAMLIKTSGGTFVQYYAKEDRDKITFTLTSECDVWISTKLEHIYNMMVVEGEDTTVAYIPYGDSVQSTYIKAYEASDVVGYIPTTGVNGHYEYDELNKDGTNLPGTEDNPGVWVRPFLDEQRNIIQPKQINTFTADGIHKDFWLLDNNCEITKVEILLKTRCKNVNGDDISTQDEINVVDEGVSPTTGIRYYYKHIWTEKAADDATYAWSCTQASASGDPYATKLHFTNTPATHEENLVNIRVTYIPREWEYKEADERGKIEKCSVLGKFGYFNNNRWYFTGNPDHKGMDWESGVDDPTFFPENGWTQVGSSNTAIQGYLHYGEELAIIKEDNNNDATVYMRTAVITDDQDVIFPVKQGAQGVGALSKWCLKTLHDEPLFLAKEGVYAIQGTDASQERTVPCRSMFINPKLRKDASNLCVAETFKDYYILCDPVSGRAYVADWRRSTEQLEWCVWDNVFARVIFATDDQLFFGTQDGKLCVFNFDWTNTKRYLDGMTVEINSDAQRLDGSYPYIGGEAIHAYYVTKRDYLGTIDFKKTMLADGGKILIMPMERSSASITLKTEKGEWFVDDIQTDSDEPAVVVPIRFRVKNFDSIETRIENEKPEEGLAILSVQYRYAITTDRR